MGSFGHCACGSWNPSMTNIASVRFVLETRFNLIRLHFFFFYMVNLFKQNGNIYYGLKPNAVYSIEITGSDYRPPFSSSSLPT